MSKINPSWKLLSPGQETAGFRARRFTINFYITLSTIILGACVFSSPAFADTKQQQSALPPLPLLRQDYVYDSANKRDPFIPLITSDGRYVQLERSNEDEAGSLLKVEGIVYDKYGLSYAIVDGSVVKVGDLISDYQVLAIEEKR